MSRVETLQQNEDMIGGWLGAEYAFGERESVLGG